MAHNRQEKRTTLIHFFVRSDVNQHDFCPARINKIKDEPVFVRNPE